jgi:hypothetical protein
MKLCGNGLSPALRYTFVFFASFADKPFQSYSRV